jgi:hypothetical protein
MKGIPFGMRICEAFLDEVGSFLVADNQSVPRDTAICIHPALPSGVPGVDELASS